MDTPALRLKQARRDAGFASATAAAKLLKWNVNTYRSHENGKREFKRAAASRYAEAFRVSLQWLLFGEGPGAMAGLLSGYVTDNGRVVKDNDGLDIELIGLSHDGGGMVLLVQTLDLDPKFEMNDVLLISDRDIALDTAASHTGADRIWCYIELDGYRPFVAKVLKVAGEENLLIDFPTSFSDRALPTVPNIRELVVPIRQLRCARPLRAVVTPEGWHYRVTEISERLKMPAGT